MTITTVITTTTTSKYFSSYNFEQILNIKFDPTFLPVVATSFTFFIFLYKFINPVLSNILIKDYKSFTDAQKIDWSTRYNLDIMKILRRWLYFL